MFALITAAKDHKIHRLDVAGVPLLVRQLQWLRGCGVQHVALAWPEGEAAEWLAPWLHGIRVGCEVIVLPLDVSAPAREVARTGGIPDEAPFLCVPADTLGNCNVAHLLQSAGDADAVVRAWHASGPATGGPAIGGPAPSALEAKGPVGAGTLRVVGVTHTTPVELQVPGWLRRVENRRQALLLSEQILTGELRQRCAAPGGWEVVLHGAEVSPGVWVSRHAQVHPTAKLEAPAFVGAGALVSNHAVVGPCAVLGERSVLAPRAEVSHSVVEADTVIGESVVVTDNYVTPSGLIHLDSEEVSKVENKLLLSERRRFKWGRS